ncbi:DUF3482 domain-containing protein [Comamonadaceae bacterium OH2545_COT-014]|nr:DUF3482 domain-containing protein [Comamonadaceae bacterium OH2545_COT-014]
MNASPHATDTAAGPIRIAVVGHTNAGKTSLLRTLTRQVDFGEVSDRPGTTRHAERVDLRLNGVPAVRFFDTPGLEDAVALLDYLNALPPETLPPHASRPDRVRAFLRGPEARGAFEQEAKVLRTLLEQADAAMLVIDTREPVLPKYRAEIDILTWCAKPVMPVLNFVRAPGSRRGEWHRALLESNLHAQAEFDAVAPFTGAESTLYRDLATLLRERRAQLDDIVRHLALQAADRQQAALRAVASTLIDVAAMRRQISAQDYQAELRRSEFVRAFQHDVAAHARQAVDALLHIHAFRPGDAEAARLPQLHERWEDDLFNPALLKAAGKRLGLGAAVGAGIGAVADVALAGLSLGAAATLGGAIGSAVSGGWRPLWRKLENRLNGVQELTAQDAVLALLASHLLALAAALAQRGHAAQDKLRASDLPGAPGSRHGPAASAHPPATLPAASPAIARAIRALAPARARPDWEHHPGQRPPASASRDALVLEVAHLLAADPGAAPEHTPAQPPPAAAPPR